ncbi:MAG TPA: protein kinase [Actinocrinis sp.]
MEPLGEGDPSRIGGYTLLGRLGEGGMGQVYLGRSPGGRLAAVKVVREQLLADPGFRDRFRREAAIARKISGAFTAPVIDADPGAPTPWLATGYVDGPSLYKVVADRGPIPAPLVLGLAAGLAEALASIHRAGLMHRDLKPSNILLAEDGPRVIDFGIARAVEPDGGEGTGAALTVPGMLIGSVGYLAPEQLTDGVVGPAGDVFALGSVLCFAATGVGAFGRGPVPTLLFRIAHEEPRLDAVADPGLRALIADCLNKDPAQRPTPEAILARPEVIAAQPPTRTLVPEEPPTQTQVPAQPTARDAELDEPPATPVDEVGSTTTVTSQAADTTARPGRISRRRLLTAAAIGGPLAAAGIGAALYETLHGSGPAKPATGGAAVSRTPGSAPASAAGTSVQQVSHVTTPAGGSVTALAVSPDGFTIACADISGVVSLWDIAQLGQPARSATVPGASGPLGPLAFSRDAKLLAVCTSPGPTLWNVAVPTAPALEATLPAPKEGAPSCLAFSPDGAHIAVGDTSGGIEIRAAAHPSASTTGSYAVDGTATAVAYSSDGKHLAASDMTGEVKLWDLSGAQAGARFQAVAEGHYVASLAFGATGGTLVTTDTTGDVTLWSTPSFGTYKRAYVFRPAKDDTDHGKAWAAFSPSGEQLVIAWSLAMRLWDVAEPARPVLLADFGDFATTGDYNGPALFTASGKSVVTATGDGATFWRVVT